MFLFLFLIFAVNIFAQSDLCITANIEAQELLKNYKYSELEKKLEEATALCPLEKNYNLHNMLALVYLWREKFDKAKPIIEKIIKEIDYMQSQDPTAQKMGKTRYLNIIYANYSNKKEEIEKEILNFNDLNLRSQEAMFFYFLSNNDKRFLLYYGMRKQYKGDNVPLLCKVYCKKNNMVQDCPCQENIEKKYEGGVYEILKGYLNGEDLNTLKAKIEKNYKEAPALKKELFDILNIK